MIVAFTGLLGGGKTIMMIIEGLNMKKKGYSVLGNLWTSYGEYWDYKNLLRFEVDGTCLLCDEMETVMDSRTNPQANVQFSYFQLQSRHRRNHIFYTTQLMSMIDLRLEGITDYFVKCVRHPSIPVLVGFKEEIPPPKYLHYEVYDRSGFLGQKNIAWKKLEPFTKMYRQHEIVLPEAMKLKINFGDVLEIFELSNSGTLEKPHPNKLTFINLLEKKEPVLSQYDAETIFNLLKGKHLAEAKEFVAGLNRS